MRFMERKDEESAKGRLKKKEIIKMVMDFLEKNPNIPFNYK